MDSETVTLPKGKYESLLKDSRILECLEWAGTDNTEAYSQGMQRYYQLYEPEDDAAQAD